MHSLTWHQSRCCVFYSIFFLVCVIYYVECFHIAPQFVTYGSNIYNCLLLIASYILANVIYNLKHMIFRDPSVASLMLVNQSTPDWSYCLKCESVRPPRAHHCRRCDTCVLRFDHHCVFLTQCLGYSNIEYFLHLLIYFGCGCLISSSFNIPYCISFITSDWQIWQRVLCTLNPLPFFMIGWLSVNSFLICILTSTCFVLSPTFIAFFIYHMKQVCCNQTTIENIVATSKYPISINYEDELRPIDYNLGRWKANVEQTLGHNWLLCFILPFVPSLKTSDGLTYPVKPKAYTTFGI